MKHAADWIMMSRQELSDGRTSVGAWGLLPVTLAHGTGAAGFDEIFIFGGIGVIIGALIFMSWRAGRQRKKNGGRRRPR